jgi:jasmonate ZIM domain-containing protein
MAASARQGERATSFAMACNLLSQFVRKNGAAAVDLGLGINKGQTTL